MRNIGIIGAMDLEIKLIRDSMEAIKHTKAAGFDFYSGSLAGKPVVLTCCGVGKVNAAACTQLLVDRYHVDCIINTGIAGGLHGEVKVCDLVISENVTYHDVRKGQMRSCFPFKEYFEADQNLIEAASKACSIIEMKKFKHHKGRIVSGERFVDDIGLKEQIIEQYSPHCVEMEGAAIGHVAHLNSIPFVVIRSISDNADDAASMSYEAFEKISAEISASVALNMIKLID